MKFIREIPIDKIADGVILELHNFGFVLVWKKTCLQIWGHK